MSSGSTAPPAAGAGGAGRGARWLFIAGQLALVLWVAHVYRIEELRRFDRLIPVVFAGFLIHSFAPPRIRVPAFVGLSWAGAIAVLGAVPTLWLVGAGLALVGICHLPLAFGARIAILIAAGAGLAAARAGRIEVPEAAALMLPILGSMFMIRMILYCYDLRHGQEPRGWLGLAYFFLLPNVCFPLFPAVDSRTFARSWYDDAANHIYQKGLVWIARGILHIVLYRLVYMHVLPAPTEVDGFWRLVVYTVGSYFIYIRISGLFHVAVGILCLFGFDLPETHRRYFLATSFTDLWHRINIYWTAFMTKVIYYPVLMRFRRSGARLAMSLAVAAVFASTTLLHAYQWFWLRGSTLVPLNDVLFFGIFGALVLAAGLNRGDSRRTPGAFGRSFRATGVFLVVSVLWTMWNSPSVSEWAQVTWANRGSAIDLALLVLVALAVALGGGVVGRLRARAEASGRWTLAAPARVVLVSLGLLVIAQPEIQKGLGPRVGSILATVDDDRFSHWDEDQLIHGYYEGLLVMNRLNSRAWESRLTKPANATPLRESDAVVPTDGVPAYELVPSRETPFRDTILRTNRWAMRDDEYAKVKPPGTFRVALLGSSYVMGWGVNHDETFEALLEARLNADPPDGTIERYEILNFAVGGYTVVDQVVLSRSKVFEFEPDVVLYVSHTGMSSRELDRLTEYLTDGAHERSPILRELVDRLHVDPELGPPDLRRELRRKWEAIVDWAYGDIVAACRRNEALPLFVLLPKIRQTELFGLDRRLIEQAEEAGFTTIVLEAVYADWDPAAIRIAPWDYHPNSLGHRLIAGRLYDELVKHAILERGGGPGP